MAEHDIDDPFAHLRAQEVQRVITTIKQIGVLASREREANNGVDTPVIDEQFLRIQSALDSVRSPIVD